MIRETFPNSTFSSTTLSKNVFKKLYTSISQVVFDMKPWDDHTNWDEVVTIIREKIVMKGVVWGSSQKKPIAYGIEKLQIVCQYKDQLYSLEDIEQQFDLYLNDYVQAVDVLTFLKLKNDE